jgi:hypothetical protein
MESNNYAPVRMGNYDINLQPSTVDEGYELPKRMIKEYQMETGGSNGGGVLTVPVLRLP